MRKEAKMTNPPTTLDKIDLIARVILGGERSDDGYTWYFPEYRLVDRSTRMEFDDDMAEVFETEEARSWTMGLVLEWYAWMAKEHGVEIVNTRFFNKEYIVVLADSSSTIITQDNVEYHYWEATAPSLHMALFEAMYLWAVEKEKINNLTNDNDDN